MPTRLLKNEMGTGLFGKLPAIGDFVARGLPAGVRTPLDVWLTNRIVPLAATAICWPEGGVRAAIELAQTPCLLLIEPSEDAVGRRYPLVACTRLAESDRAAADTWGDVVWPILLRGVEDGASLESLRAESAEMAVPTATSAALVPPLVWWPGVEPAAQDVQLARLAQISSG